MLPARFYRALGVVAFLGLAHVSCSAKSEDTVTVRNNGVMVSMQLPGWSFASYSEAEKLYLYQKESQQLYFAVSKYKLHDRQSPGDELVKEALLELCPEKACTPTQTKPEYWVSHYASGTTGSAVQNWDVARLTPKGEMLVSIVRLVRGTKEGQAQIDRAIQTSLKIERD